MSGKHHYHVMSNAYDKDHLMEMGRKNGVHWEEDSHEGVNWMRFSHAMIQHLDENKPFYHDDTDPQILQEMINNYSKLREMHKQTMVPQIRAAMTKLHCDRGDANLRPIDLLQEAHEHLSANGGHQWSEKVQTLHGLNTQINNLTQKLQHLTRFNTTKEPTQE